MTSHCAKFTDSLLPVAEGMLRGRAETILDPFAGTGKGVDYLRGKNYTAWGVELEPEFIGSEFVIQGSALALPFSTGSFDACFTSPTYGNRLADKDLRPSVSGTYAKSLGRMASQGSSCHLQWGDAYKEFHLKAWTEMKKALKPDGYFLLNIKDHIRNKKPVKVTDWHARTIVSLDFAHVTSRFVPTPGNRRGRNSDARTEGEWLILFRKQAKQITTENGDTEIQTR